MSKVGCVRVTQPISASYARACEMSSQSSITIAPSPSSSTTRAPLPFGAAPSSFFFFASGDKAPSSNDLFRFEVLPLSASRVPFEVLPLSASRVPLDGDEPASVWDSG